jgi:hypothetical protein
LKRFYPPVRRVLVLGGAALVGVAAAVALASPASAHHPIVTGNAVCDTAVGDWVVTWTVDNSESDLQGRLIDVDLTPAGTTVTNIVVGATLPRHGEGTLTGTQKVPARETSARLTVEGQWNRDGRIIQAKDSATVTFEGRCAPPEQPTTPKPSASFATACDGQVTVTLANAADATAPAEFTVTGKNGFTAKKTVAPGAEDKSIVVPAANSGEITVTSGDFTATGKRVVPGSCGGLPVTGVKVGAAAAGALGLVGVGAGLFLVARRRRVRFTV